MEWFQLLGGGSIGSLITLLIKNHFDHKKEENRKREVNFEFRLHKLYSPLYLYLVVLMKCLSEILNYLNASIKDSKSESNTDLDISNNINSIVNYHNRIQVINEKILLLVAGNFGYLSSGDEGGIIQYIEFSEKIRNIKWVKVKRRCQIEAFITAYEMIIKSLNNIKSRCYVSICESKVNLETMSFEESLEILAPLIKEADVKQV